MQETNFPVKRPWIALVRIEVRGSQSYRTMGPWSTDEVLESLRSGTVHFQDFIWQKGMSQWIRIADHESFGKQNIKTDAPTYEWITFSEEETSRSPWVIRPKPYSQPRKWEIPKEASGPDLVQYDRALKLVK